MMGNKRDNTFECWMFSEETREQNGILFIIIKVGAYIHVKWVRY